MSDNSSLKNHVFISYAHIDNSHFSGTEKGWIDLLHERLEVRLAMLLGRSPKIWRDSKLRGHDAFNTTIALELARSEILLSVVTPRYVESDSCREEIESFFQSAALTGGVQLGDKHRVFKAVKTYVPYAQHPPGTKDLLGYEFYERDQASERVREFDNEIGSQREKDKRYWDKFEDLVWDIHEAIKFLESPTPTNHTSTDVSIYLAETTSDLSEERDKIKRELQQFGHTVFPDKALPLNGPTLQQTVRGYLERCRLSVHLIGENYGVIPEMETERSIVRLQEELAVEQGDNAEFSRLIWMPPGLQPADERQRKFITDLQNSFTSHNGSELLQVKLEDLKTIIQTKLIQKPKPPPVVINDVDIIRVYLICDQQDVDAAEPLRNYLFSRDFEVTLPLQDGSEAEALEDHRENLLICDAVVIFQSRASEGWLRMKLRELLKLPGYGRTTPLLGKMIYIDAPESPTKERFMTREAVVIKNYGGFDPTDLEPFVAQLGKGKGRSL